jgi:hypothetical protein
VVFDFATSCKKSDKQVIKKEEAVRSFPAKIDFDEEVPYCRCKGTI